MYQVQSYERGKLLKSFDTFAEAQADAKKRANRYHIPYCIMWFEPGTGTVMQMNSPDQE